MPKCRIIHCIAKISFLKKEGIEERNSYERRVYESVDDKSLSYAISQYFTLKDASGTNGLIADVTIGDAHIESRRGQASASFLHVLINFVSCLNEETFIIFIMQMR